MRPPNHLQQESQEIVPPRARNLDNGEVELFVVKLKAVGKLISPRNAAARNKS